MAAVFSTFILGAIERMDSLISKYSHRSNSLDGVMKKTSNNWGISEIAIPILEVFCIQPRDPESTICFIRQSQISTRWRQTIAGKGRLGCSLGSQTAGSRRWNCSRSGQAWALTNLDIKQRFILFNCIFGAIFWSYDRFFTVVRIMLLPYCF